jgi:hypothetical protein
MADNTPGFKRLRENSFLEGRGFGGRAVYGASQNFSPGGRAFKPAETLCNSFGAFSPGVRSLPNSKALDSLSKNWPRISARL